MGTRIELRGMGCYTEMQVDEFHEKAEKKIKQMLTQKLEDDGSQLIDWIYDYYLVSPNRGITVNTEEEWDGYHFSACIGEYYNGIPEHVEGSVIELGVADAKGSVIFADIIAKKMTETLEVLAEELSEGVID